MFKNDVDHGAEQEAVFAFPRLTFPFLVQTGWNIHVLFRVSVP